MLEKLALFGNLVHILMFDINIVVLDFANNNKNKKNNK